MSNVQSVKRDIVIEASLEQVWQALTQPEHLNKWYTKEASVDFRVGGRMEMAFSRLQPWNKKQKASE